MKTKLLLLSLTILFFISVISANGLMVQNGTVFLNKTVGIESTFTFDLKNTDSFTFYNISFADNSVVEMITIPELTSGQLAHVTATIVSDVDFNGDIKIKGFYYTELGSSNETYNVNIDYTTGLSPCDFSIVEGDSIFWENNAVRDVKLMNYNSGVEITSILDSGNYTQSFLEPLILKYFSSWFGFQFTGLCTITVLDSEGLIQNPGLDGVLNINLTVEYTPTDLKITFLINEYDMHFYDTEEGVFLVKNNGTNTAKNIKFEANWFTFTPNNFDLNSGLSRTIAYSITPDIAFTNETNETYTKDLTITGNFPTITEEFEIFIKYTDIDSGDYTEADNLLSLIKQFCEDNPEICSGTPKVIYRDTNDTDINITVATGQLRQIFEYMYNSTESDKEYQKFVKESLYDFNLTIYSVGQNQNQTSLDIKKLKDQADTSDALSIFTILGFSTIVIFGGGGYIIYYMWNERKIKKLRTMS